MADDEHLGARLLAQALRKLVEDRAQPLEGDGVAEIFKGFQLDVGAPPEFMDFRYVVHDHDHGEFYLDHCGALLDVEPMGPDYVKGMCHDIEDPTFDATALATNRKAQVRPIHRPPRTPADQHPHCRWTVIIDESYPEVPFIPEMDIVAATNAHACELDPIDPDDDGASDYSGELLADVDFAAFSHSALVRIADEVCLQMHLLVKSFQIAVEKRAGADTELARSIRTKQLIGIAGVAADRIHKALKLPTTTAGALRVLELHPLLNPAAYVSADTDPDFVHVRTSPAYEDGSWISLVSPVSDAPLQAIVYAVDPHLRAEVSGTESDWTVRVIETDTAAKKQPEVEVCDFSGGASWVFEERKSLPLTVV